MIVYALFEYYCYECESTSNMVNLFQTLVSAELAKKDMEEKLVEPHRGEISYYIAPIAVL